MADVIRQVKPTHVITHWKASLHPDHAAANRIVNEAVLLAEDAEGFVPYLYVDVTEDLAAWKAAVTSYE